MLFLPHPGYSDKSWLNSDFSFLDGSKLSAFNESCWIVSRPIWESPEKENMIRVIMRSRCSKVKLIISNYNTSDSSKFDLLKHPDIGELINQMSSEICKGRKLTTGAPLNLPLVGDVFFNSIWTLYCGDVFFNSTWTLYWPDFQCVYNRFKSRRSLICHNTCIWVNYMYTKYITYYIYTSQNWTNVMFGGSRHCNSKTNLRHLLW